MKKKSSKESWQSIRARYAWHLHPPFNHKFYRELVKPADARAWFNVRPESAVENATPAQLPFGHANAKQNFIAA